MKEGWEGATGGGREVNGWIGWDEVRIRNEKTAGYITLSRLEEDSWL